jgi:iron transport multicopper oxidase
MLQPSNTQFRPPLPDSIVINEGGSTRIPFHKGKTYRFRMISFSAFGSCLVHFQNHTMQVIMQDGSYVTRAEASQIYLSPGQRYDVLISAADTDSGNYPFLFSLDVNPDFRAPTLPLGFPYNQTGYLVTDPSQNSTSVDVVHVWNPVDSTQFTNPAGEGPLGPVGTSIKLDVSFCFDNNSIPRSCLNGKPYVPQRVPTLYSAATTGDDNANPAVYGGVNPFIAPGGEIIEIILNNHDTGSHPFHLHGHQFQVLAAPASNSGSFSGDTSNFPANPAYRDVFLVNAKSHAVIRFKADNPGAWLFHCHNEWHVEMGLTATVIEDPAKLKGLVFPQDHIDVCKAIGQPYRGNAAGNTQNYTDTAGMLFVNPTTYTG